MQTVSGARTCNIRTIRAALNSSKVFRFACERARVRRLSKNTTAIGFAHCRKHLRFAFARGDDCSPFQSFLSGFALG